MSNFCLYGITDFSIKIITVAIANACSYNCICNSIATELPEQPVNMTSSMFSPATASTALITAPRILNPRKYKVVPFQLTGVSLEKQ